ncbi:MAG: DUF6152 family protein [Steroidobacteraceae bacterium]
MTTRWSGIGVVALLAALPAFAHHSFAAFDLKKTVEVDGELTQVKFTNPHSWFQLKVTGADGKEELWNVEGLSPQQLFSKGLTRSAMKVGDHVKISVNPLRSGAPGGSLVSVTLADGTVLNGGPGQ